MREIIKLKPQLLHVNEHIKANVFKQLPKLMKIITKKCPHDTESKALIWNIKPWKKKKNQVQDMSLLKLPITSSQIAKSWKTGFREAGNEVSIVITTLCPCEFDIGKVWQHPWSTELLCPGFIGEEG